MNDVIIKAEKLGKMYTIGHQVERGRYTALRDVLMQNVRSLWNKTKDLAQGKPIIQGDTMEEVWALKDVNFEIKRGEAVGIIGRNGAGKSTLLKILSRITEPTTGRLTIRGRVASLLEVGTGFHPELSGRENIYLNGTILGMTRVEIKQKFDEIVAFAEIEKFLDTPVKRYSSGMYVRLAFAVAAHLEPEILIIDEVLAVGDAQFQKKCLGKMEEVGKEGRTVLFVSHNMQVIKSLCSTGFLLEKGELVKEGSMSKVIEHYENIVVNPFLNQNFERGTLYLKNDIDYSKFNIVEISIVDQQGHPCRHIKTFDSFSIKIKFYSPRKQNNASVDIYLKTITGVVLLKCATRPDSTLDMDFKEGLGIVLCNISQIPLPAGTYFLDVGLAIPLHEWLCLEKDLCKIEIERNDIHNSGFPPSLENAACVAEYNWEILE